MPLADWLPEHVLWLPLTPPGGEWVGGLLLARDNLWNEAEKHLLTLLTEAYAHAWEALEMRPSARRNMRQWVTGHRWLRWLLVLLILATLTLPLRQSVLAPATVVAQTPIIVRTPLAGVVDRFHIRPNQAVAVGDPLFDLDATELTNQLEVSRKSQSIYQAEYRQVAQKAVFDRESKASLTILKARMDQQAAEADYIEVLLQRIQIRASRAGIAVFDDVNDWLGKPVVLGERILEIADPAQVVLDIRLPIGDAINLEPGAEVVLFLRSDPHNPAPATLRFASYKAGLTAENILAYRLKAEFQEGTPFPRIGLRGMAKIYGSRVPLYYYILRRPLAALRQFMGV